MFRRKQVAEAQIGERLPVIRQILLSLLWFGENFQTAALLPIVVPAQVLLFVPGSVGNGRQAGTVAVIGGIASIAALIAQPVSGHVSDRTRSPLGRRRPYVMLGATVAVIGGVVAAFGSSLAIFIAGVLLIQLGTNVLLGGYQGLLPDLVPEHQRGSASGYLGLMTIVGNVASFGIAAFLLSSVKGGALAGPIHRGALLFYLITAAVLAVTTVITVAGVKEHGYPRLRIQLKDLESAPGVRALASRWLRPWLAPWRHHNFRWVWLTRAAVMFGITLFLSFIEYYFAAVAHRTSFISATVILVVLALGAAVVSALLVGWLSDRVGRVRPVAVTTAAMALAALVFVVAPAGVPLWPLGLLFGLGYGAYSSVDWALAVDALPELAAAGRDMGIWSIASTLPMVLAPLVGGGLIAAFSGAHTSPIGYRAVFALATIFMLGGAVFVLRIREGAAASTRAA